MNIYNRELIDPIDPVVFENAKGAIQYAVSEYWVSPIVLTTEEQSFAFVMAVRPGDFAQSGKIHYTRR